MFGQEAAGGEGEDVVAGAGSGLLRKGPAVLKMALLGCLGASLALIAVPAFPPRFHGETPLIVKNASDASIRSAIAQVFSEHGQDKLVQGLKGAQAKMSLNEPPTASAVVLDLLTGGRGGAADDATLRQEITGAVDISFDPPGNRVLVRVTADAPHRVKMIADQVAQEFRHALQKVEGSVSDPRIIALERTAARAKAGLEAFTTELDPALLRRARSFQQDREALEADLSAAEAALAAARKRHQDISSMTLADVLDKPLPDSLEFTGLEYQRQRYVQAQLDLAALSARLGPLHPKRTAAQTTLDEARDDIKQALRSLVSSLRTQVGSAETSLAELKNRQAGGPEDKHVAETAARFGLLQAAADEAGRNLDLAKQNAPEVGSNTPSVELAAPVSPVSATGQAVTPTGLAILGAIAGWMAGLLPLLRKRPRRTPPTRDRNATELLPQDLRTASHRAPLPRTRSENGTVMRELPPASAGNRRQTMDRAVENQVRAMLTEKRGQAEVTALPPLVASALTRLPEAGRQHKLPLPAPDPARMSRDEEAEIEQLRRAIAELRQKVEHHAARRWRGSHAA